MNMEHVKNEWTNLEALLLYPNAEDTIEFATNVSIEVLVRSFGDTVLKRYLNMNVP